MLYKCWMFCGLYFVEISMRKVLKKSFYMHIVDKKSHIDIHCPENKNIIR